MENSVSLENEIKELTKKMEEISKVKDCGLVTYDVVWTTETEGSDDHATMDSGSPKDIGGIDWVVEYCKNQNIELKNLRKEKNNEAFRFGVGKVWPTLYVVVLPFSFKDVEGEAFTVMVRVNVVEAKIPLLIGRYFHRKYNVAVFHGKGTALMDLDGTHMFDMIDSTKGHWLLKLQTRK